MPALQMPESQPPASMRRLRFPASFWLGRSCIPTPSFHVKCWSSEKGIEHARVGVEHQDWSRPSPMDLIAVALSEARVLIGPSREDNRSNAAAIPLDCLDRQQTVIDRSQTRARHHHHLRLKLPREHSHIRSGRDWNTPAPSTFHDQKVHGRFTIRHLRDQVEVDWRMLKLGRNEWRHGIHKLVDATLGPCLPATRSCGDDFLIWTDEMTTNSFAASFDRLVREDLAAKLSGAPSQSSCNECLACAGVGPGYEQPLHSSYLTLNPKVQRSAHGVLFVSARVASFQVSRETETCSLSSSCSRETSGSLDEGSRSSSSRRKWYWCLAGRRITVESAASHASNANSLHALDA